MMHGRKNIKNTHTGTRARTIGILWTNDSFVAQICTQQDTILNRDIHQYQIAGLETLIPAFYCKLVSFLSILYFW